MPRSMSAERLRNHVPRSIAAPVSLSHPLGESVLENLRDHGRTYRNVDLILLTATFLVALSVRYSGVTHLFSLSAILLRDVSFAHILIGSICILAWRSILNAVGVYDPIRIRSFKEYLARCVVGSGACSLLVGGLLEVVNPETDVVTGLSYWAISLLLMLSARILSLSFDHSIRQRFRVKRRVLIVGTGPRAVEVFEELRRNRDSNYSLVGYVDSDPRAGYVAADQVIGTLDQLENILMHNVVDEVVIALPIRSQYDAIGDAVATCERLGVQSQYFTHHFGTRITKGRRATGSRGDRMILEPVRIDDRLHTKRAFDVVGAFCGLILLFPLLLATAIAIKLTSRGPVLYHQKRFGLNKRVFSMLKFRSMVVEAEKLQANLEHLNETSGPAFKIANDPRITSIGKFLRKMSIDELPQLVNVLVGDMSLVGPRPLPTRDVSRFSEAWLMRRFSVKPGLTCLWQISGRSGLDFDRWIELDLEYIDKWSLTLDMGILLKTVPAVLKGRGAS